MQTNLLIAAILVHLPQVAYAQSTWWEETPHVVLVNSGPRGEVTYRKGDDLLQLPLLWGDAARIEAPVTFDFAGKQETVPANSTLPLVRFRQFGQGTATRSIYCTRSRITERLKSGGLVGIMTSKIMNSLKDSQKCLEDTDNDGKFDRTLIIGEGDNDFKIGASIEPVSFVPMSLSQIEGEGDYLKLELTGVSKDKVFVGLRIKRNNEDLFFVDISSGGFYGRNRTPIKFDGSSEKRIEIFGIQFDVIAIDVASKTVKIRWPNGAQKDRLLTIPIDVRMTY
jgi:hypothetical protein